MCHVEIIIEEEEHEASHILKERRETQEKWICANRDRLNCHVMMGIGGSLDVFAGTVERAPEFWCKYGLEWLYRLIKEPWRFKRMMALPKFGFTVLFKGKRYKKGQN